MWRSTTVVSMAHSPRRDSRIACFREDCDGPGIGRLAGGRVAGSAFLLYRLSYGPACVGPGGTRTRDPISRNLRPALRLRSRVHKTRGRLLSSVHIRSARTWSWPG